MPSSPASTALSNWPLGVASSPYTITYSYTDPRGALAPASDSSQVLTVTQATPTITWTSPAAIFSGTALSASQLDATANVPGSFAYSPGSGAVLSVGRHTLSVTFTPSDTADYSSATASVQLIVSLPPPPVIVVLPLHP